MTDETRVRLLAFDYIENKPARYPYDLIAAAKTVMIVEGFEMIEICIGKGEDIAGFNAGLNVPTYRYVARELRQGIYVNYSFGAQYRERNAGHSLGLNVGFFQVILDKQCIRGRHIHAAVDNEENGQLVENRVRLEIIEKLH